MTQSNITKHFRRNFEVHSGTAGVIDQLPFTILHDLGSHTMLPEMPALTMDGVRAHPFLMSNLVMGCYLCPFATEHEADYIVHYFYHHHGHRAPEEPLKDACCLVWAQRFGPSQPWFRVQGTAKARLIQLSEESVLSLSLYL